MFIKLLSNFSSFLYEELLRKVNHLQKMPATRKMLLFFVVSFAMIRYASITFMDFFVSVLVSEYLPI